MKRLMVKPILSIIHILALAGLLYLGLSSTVGAATLIVPSVANPTIQDGINNAGVGDTISIAALTFNENIVLDKNLIIEGAGPGATILDKPGIIIKILSTASGSTIKNLTIQNGSQAIRFEDANKIISNVEINNVEFLDNSDRGIELHNLTTIINLSVIDSTFIGNRHGIRSSSSTFIDGLTVTGSTFGSTLNDNQVIGIYQANDGGTSRLRNLQVDDCTFINHSDSGIFAEEIRDSKIENSAFTDNRRGMVLFKNYTGAGVDVENVTIRNNQFTDSINSSIIIFHRFSGLGGPFIIDNNKFDQDVGLLTDNFAVIDVRLDSNFTHAPLTISNNTVNLSENFLAATATFGIKLRGGLNGVTVSGNKLNGGNVGNDTGGPPPTSGIFVQTDDATMGKMSEGDVLNIIDCNSISGFVNGISFYDPEDGSFGNLPSGVVVNVNKNSIFNNSNVDINNDGTSATINAENNFWGGGSILALNVDSDPFLIIPPVCADNDHIQCYDIDWSTRIPRKNVKLDDQFAVRKNVRVSRKAEKYCTTVIKNDEQDENPDDTWTCYKVKGFKPKLKVKVNNQFGQQLFKLKESELLCVPSEQVEVTEVDKQDDDDDDDDDD